ncbi:MAG: hypothetical protein ACK4OM_03290 [Alphaproteobacteria bacterium]
MKGKGNKTQVFKKDYAKERKQFFENLMYRIKTDCTQNIENFNAQNSSNPDQFAAPEDVIAHYTNHSTKEVEKLAKRIIDNMADIDFDISFKKKLDLQLQISNEIINDFKDPKENLITTNLSAFLQNIKAIIQKIVIAKDNPSIVKEALDKAEKNEISRLNGKEGSKVGTYGFKEKELQALKWMTEALNDKELSENKLKFVQEFIKDSMGNQRLNNVLDKARFVKISGIDLNLIGTLYSFTFKTKNIKDFDNIYGKLEKNINRIENEMELDSKHKITLNEYGTILDIISVQSFIKKLQGKKLFTNHKTLESLYNKVEKLFSIVKKLILILKKS